jgi:ABC-type sugar transport system ATPase subunit
MAATWKQADVFPIIAQTIRDLHANEKGFVTHDQIAAALLADPAAAKIIEQAQQESDKERTIEWFAHNMVAWFSERITVGQSDWDNAFDRMKIDGKWAYKPKDDDGIGVS